MLSIHPVSPLLSKCSSTSWFVQVRRTFIQGVFKIQGVHPIRAFAQGLLPVTFERSQPT